MAYKVLMINGSPHVKGCTATGLEEIQKVLEQEGIEVTTLQVGNKAIKGCQACGYCRNNGECVIKDDLVNEAAKLFEEADGLIVGSPVHYASPSGAVLAFLDRLFYSTPFNKQMKVGAAIASARRGGTTATFDALNKYFTISGMPVVSSTYWNNIHGFTAEDAKKDLEGMQVMRNLGRNMAFMIKAIDAQKQKEGLPEMEREAFTSFCDNL